MDLNGKKVLVVGLARTGMATAKFLKAKGSIVSTTEMKPKEEMKEAVQELEGMDISRNGVAIRQRPFSTRTSLW